MKKPYLAILPTLLFGIIVGAYLKPTDVIQTAQATDIKYFPIPNEYFSADSVINYMKKLNIKYIEFSYAQIEHETGNYSSNIFKENHNLFGLKVAYLRPTPTTKENRGHAKYVSWKESVIDFALLQTRILAKTKSKKEYMDYIQKFYSDDEQYLTKVNKIVEENRKNNIF